MTDAALRDARASPRSPLPHADELESNHALLKHLVHTELQRLREREQQLLAEVAAAEAERAAARAAAAAKDAETAEAQHAAEEATQEEAAARAAEYKVLFKEAGKLTAQARTQKEYGSKGDTAVPSFHMRSSCSVLQGTVKVLRINKVTAKVQAYALTRLARIQHTCIQHPTSIHPIPSQWVRHQLEH
jgi:hypothetical protein